MEIKELIKDYPEFENETLIISSLEKDPNFKNAKSAADWAKKTYKSDSYITRVGDLVLATHPYSVVEILLNYDYYDCDNEISLGDRDYKELAKLSCHIFDKSDNLSDNIHLVRTNDNTVDVFSNEDVCFKVLTGFDYQAAFVLTMLYLNNKIIERLDESCVFELAGKINAALLDGEHEYTIYRNKITPMLVVLQNLEPVERGGDATMVTRFLPELENGERQKFTAEVEGFNIEILFKDNGYMSYDPTHFDDMYDNLPNFDLRVRLSNIKSDDYHFDVQDATIPLGKQFNELGLPNIGDHILFTSRPATQDGLIKAFKYVNNVKYLNEDIHPVIQDQRIDFELLGYLIVERMFDIQFVRNQHEKIRKIGINRIKPLIDYCKKRYLRKIKHQRDQKLMMVESDIFQKENIQEYRNTNDCNDKIYVQRGKIIDQDKICLIIAKNLKDRFGQETKQQFCEKFANDNHTIDTSALALRKTIRAIIDDYNA